VTSLRKPGAPVVLHPATPSMNMDKKTTMENPDFMFLAPLSGNMSAFYIIKPVFHNWCFYEIAYHAHHDPQ